MSVSKNAGQPDDNPRQSVSERPKRRQEAFMDQSIADIFHRLVNADAQAAEKLRNTLIETNPRLAWRLTAQLPTKDSHHARDESPSAMRVIQESEQGQNAAHRGFRESVLDGGWLKVSAMSAAWPSSAQTRQAREKALTPPSATRGRVVGARSGPLDTESGAATGARNVDGVRAQKTPPSSAPREEAIFGSRSAFRLGLWAISQNQRRKELSFAGRAIARGESETSGLMELAAPLLRGPFSEGDAMAFLRLLVGPAAGQNPADAPQTLMVNAAAASSLPLQTTKEKEAEWSAQAATFMRRSLTLSMSVSRLELIVQEALRS